MSEIGTTYDWFQRAAPRTLLLEENRIEVVIGVHDIQAADLAVCSSDAEGSPGQLNQFVFERAGIHDKLFDVFRPPACLLNQGRPPVLVVQTVGPGRRTKELLAQSLLKGLEMVKG